MKINRMALLSLLLVVLTLLSSGGAIVFAQASPPTLVVGNTRVYLPLVERRSEDVSVQAQESQPARAPQLKPTVPITRTDFVAATLISSLSARPELFVKCVDNPYFPLIPGTVYHYTEQAGEELLTVNVTVTNQIKEIQGIHATQVRDTVLLNNEVKEDTTDWYAQDDRGNVWYLGEDTAEYENGQVVSTAGTWLAGVKGAVPGLIMPGNSRPGDIYRQEYLKGEAEDMGAVMSLTAPATTPYAVFAKTMMSADYNSLKKLLEYKFYAPGVGLIRSDSVDEPITSQLVSISHDRAQSVLDRGCGENGGVAFVGTIRLRNGERNLEKLAKITRTDAEAAVRAVVGNIGVRKTVLEVERGFLVYTVTLNNGQDTAVDAGDGTVLAVDMNKDDNVNLTSVGLVKQ